VQIFVPARLIVLSEILPVCIEETKTEFVGVNAVELMIRFGHLELKD